MFSLLAPHTRIPSHYGDTNARLVGHLPLILPGNCRFRVGNEIREWRYGEAWLFDDTIEHEAWNDSDEVRVISDHRHMESVPDPRRARAGRHVA